VTNKTNSKFDSVSAQLIIQDDFLGFTDAMNNLHFNLLPECQNESNIMTSKG